MKDVHSKRTAKRSQSVLNKTRSRDLDICQCCGNGDGAEVHHIEPLSLGGKDETNNCISLCPDCHSNVPVNPDHFLAYQRQGGALWHRIKGISGTFEPLKKIDIDSFSYQQRINLIDQLRNRWGWKTGIDLPMNDYREESITREEVIITQYEKIKECHFVASSIAKLLNENFNCDAIQNKMEPCLEICTKSDQELNRLFNGQMTFLDDICPIAMKQITRYASQVIDLIYKANEASGIHISHLTGVVELAKEDIIELIDEIASLSTKAEKLQTPEQLTLAF